MTKDELQDLFRKYHDGTASEQERALLEAWYLQQDEPDSRILSRQAIEAAKAQVFRRLPGNEGEFLKIGLRMLAAATLIGVLVTMAVWLLPFPGQKESGLLAHDLPPGGNRAVLILPTGAHLDLSSAKTGQVVSRGGVTVTKDRQGEVHFAYTGTGERAEQHTLRTPNGGQWQVRLADGTAVWLNAASSLTFPSNFSRSANRIVKLSGEAYFEVAKDPAHPFIVISGEQRVEVLGTHFNLSNYPDGSPARTTLAEGRIKVNLLGMDETHILEPGEEAVSADQKLTVGPGDVQAALAWKNGYFRFNDEPVSSIMKKLERWYDVEVRYEGRVSNEGLNGKVSRNKNISQVIKALEATGTVHIKMEGRRITVMR